MTHSGEPYHITATGTEDRRQNGGSDLVDKHAVSTLYDDDLVN